MVTTTGHKESTVKIPRTHNANNTNQVRVKTGIHYINVLLWILLRRLTMLFVK